MEWEDDWIGKGFERARTAYFKLRSRNSPRETEEDLEKPQFLWTVTRWIFKWVTFWIQVWRNTTRKTCSVLGDMVIISIISMVKQTNLRRRSARMSTSICPPFWVTENNCPLLVEAKNYARDGGKYERFVTVQFEFKKFNSNRNIKNQQMSNEYFWISIYFEIWY
jgi:hypothetical protein